MHKVTISACIREQGDHSIAREGPSSCDRQQIIIALPSLAAFQDLRTMLMHSQSAHRKQPTTVRHLSFEMIYSEGDFQLHNLYTKGHMAKMPLINRTRESSQNQGLTSNSFTMTSRSDGLIFTAASSLSLQRSVCRKENASFGRRNQAFSGLKVEQPEMYVEELHPSIVGLPRKQRTGVQLAFVDFSLSSGPCSCGSDAA
jgi:hypothetical protein